MKRMKHPISAADTHPKDKTKTAGLAEDAIRAQDRAPVEQEVSTTEPPRSIEDAKTEEEELDRNGADQKRAESK